MFGRFILLVAISFLACSASAARVFGTVYDASLTPIDHVIVTLNTTPEQTYASLNGSYEFTVPAGSYRVKATKGNFSTYDDLFMGASRDEFRVDLIALEDFDPSNETTVRSLLENGDVSSSGLDDAKTASANPSAPVRLVPDAMGGVLVLLVLVAGGMALWFVASRWHGRTRPEPELSDAVSPPNAPPSLNSVQARGEAVQSRLFSLEPAPVLPPALDASTLRYAKPVSADQQRLLDVLKTMEGRASQKDLRKELSTWSEAKVSMELTELEDGGLIRKIKKGRGNIIRLS